jgi:TPR repeat protein
MDRLARRARLRERARRDDARACYALACDLDGHALLRRREGVRWLTRAAELGHVAAQEDLAQRFDQGAAVRSDARRAAHWWSRAADGGSPRGLVNLGLAYARGAGVPKNRARANRLYLQAAALGNRIAMHNLGLVHKHGHGVPRSARRAVAWTIPTHGSTSGRWTGAATQSGSAGRRPSTATVAPRRWATPAPSIGSWSITRDSTEPRATPAWLRLGCDEPSLLLDEERKASADSSAITTAETTATGAIRAGPSAGCGKEPLPASRSAL